MGRGLDYEYCNYMDRQEENHEREMLLSMIAEERGVSIAQLEKDLIKEGSSANELIARLKKQGYGF